ncbi:uncharacterized protein LOC135837089 [Planococcus citri]|uniref:uncharacterized protein LOC135837089 n=1 Tax=Planococcus citri TaxID=170843 RepID=UPI0031F93023
MYFTTEAFLLGFCFLKEIISITSHTQDPPTEDHYDITTTLNNSIAELLKQNIDVQTVKNLIEEMKYHRSTYEMENTLKQEPFQDRIFFHNIEIRRITSDKLTEPEIKTAKPSILYNFTTNELELRSTKLLFRIYGYIGIEPQKTNAWFRARLEYKDARVIVRRCEEEFTIRIEGDVVDNQLRLQQWDYDETNISSPYILLEELIKGIEPSSKVHIAQNVRETLINKTKLLIPSLIIDNINGNKKLMPLLTETFHRLPNQNEIISNRVVDLKDNEEQYYFFIPNFSLLGFDLTNIKIRGLWNYHSLLVQPNGELENTNRTSTRSTLVVKNIEGSMNWDHGLTDVPPLKMNFSANQLSITLDEKRKSISVRMLMYRVTGMSLRIRMFKVLHLSKLSHCTELLFGAVVGSSIMPSIRSQESTELKIDTPNVYKETLNWFRQMATDTPKRSNLTTIKLADINSPLAHKQIPTKKKLKLKLTTIQKTDIDSSSISFNQKTIDTEEKNYALEPYNYHISFPNITIKLVSTNPQAAKQLQCEFFNNSQITRHIDTMLTGTLHLNGSEGKSLPLNFHCDFKGVNFAIVKPDSLDKNGTCEFQLSPDQDIEVEVSPTENSTTLTEDELNLKRKIDTALITMATMKQRIVSNMKSIVCYPLDVCTQSVKLVDDFVQRFIDNVLRKCLLRKDEITIT